MKVYILKAAIDRILDFAHEGLKVRGTLVGTRAPVLGDESIFVLGISSEIGVTDTPEALVNYTQAQVSKLTLWSNETALATSGFIDALGSWVIRNGLESVFLPELIKQQCQLSLARQVTYLALVASGNVCGKTPSPEWRILVTHPDGTHSFFRLESTEDDKGHSLYVFAQEEAVFMKKEELAKQLDGREHGSEMNGFENREFLKKHGLVVVYGYSDDTVELDGAIQDELYTYKIEVTRNAAGQLEVANYDNCDANEFTLKELEKAGWLKPEVVFAIENKGEINGYYWFFEADVPYAPFDIFEDGEKFCRGIVIDINELINARHVDKWCENQKNDAYARFVLSVMRMPAYTEQNKFAPQFIPLYCDYGEVRSSVRSVSRFGTIQLENQNGNHTAWPDECTKWSRHI